MKHSGYLTTSGAEIYYEQYAPVRNRSRAAG